jgi:hypothetical protein
MWDMTPVIETFKVQQWRKACGAQPTSGTLNPGGPVRVHIDGRELVFETSGRTYRTDQCLDAMSTLGRDSHSTDGKSWRTRCVTPAGDPRQAVINAAYFLTGDDTISIAETGRYETVIEGGRCVVDVTRQASLHRVPPAPLPAASAARTSSSTEAVEAPPPTPTNPAEPTASTDCTNPGIPARLEVRPSRKLLRLGDAFVFSALVVDAAGCRTSTPVKWSLGQGRSESGQNVTPTGSIDAAGKLTVPPDGPDEATFEVIATAAAHSAKAAVQVASAARFEALLAQSGLDPKGERDEPSVTSLATSSLGTSNVRAADGARQRRILFISIIAGLAVVLGVVALFGARRASRARAIEVAANAKHAAEMAEYEHQKQQRERKHAAEMQAHLESVALAQQVAAEAAARGQAIGGPRICPSCHREFHATTEYCPFDSNRLVPVAGHEALAAGPSGGVCPTCRRGFNPGVRVCPNDGDELVPPALLHSQPPAARRKICPTCGDRFDGAATFCGKDGTQLVLLN